MTNATYLNILPRSIRDGAERFPDAEEIRLRAGRAPGAVRGGTETAFGEPVTSEQLTRIFDAAGGGSMHAAAESLRRGYITIPGGHRLGVCGTAVMAGGEVKLIRDFSSITIRVASERKGCSRDVIPAMRRAGGIRNTLIISPPALGKTTLLRDVVRVLASGDKPLRVALADERGEVAACYGGVPQLDVGRCTDVLEGCPKALAVMMLLRSSSPRVMAVDEITDPEDARALRVASGRGAAIVATVHGESSGAFFARQPELRDVFEIAVTISGSGAERAYKCSPI